MSDFVTNNVIVLYYLKIVKYKLMIRGGNYS